ncbi:TPA: RNA-directed DNA polymerase [Pseudomonas aeruginosa]|nr:RNA-directed DNA polymerase [Pseudomonas aeruginosa]HCF7192853.1 RNA-directed DNA polymerase [Pseudomonas aeruginosa]
MSVVDSRYDRLSPRIELLQDEVVLAQAWKKTHTFIRRYNWYADVLELDASAICLSENLTQWSESISSGDYQTAPAWLVPAPKNGLWCFRESEDGGWGPRKRGSDDEQVLRPLAHIGIREQTVATAVMLCLADCIETAQGDTSLDPLTASKAKVYSYGNRLFCSWSNDHSAATFSWGNSNTYSRYFQDYQRFVERPVALAKQAKAEGEENVFIVSLDLTAFFDNIDVDLLIERMRDEYAHFLEATEEAYLDSDEAFWATARAALKFQWRVEDQPLAELFRHNLLPSGLPQGLVGSGFFANVYLLKFDRTIGAFIGRRPRKRTFRIHDYCRYVDDIRLVISVDTDEGDFVDLTDLGKEISDWIQGRLRKHTTPKNKPDSCLKINELKTQLEPLVEVGGESGTAVRMKTFQKQLSGPFDVDSLRQVESGLTGLLSLAELSLVEDDSSRPLTHGLQLASVAKLKLEVRDDTLTRFSAYRLVRSLRMRRSMTDLTELTDGKDPKIELAQDFQAVARRLVSAWAVNPSLVQVLRYALDLYPSTDLLEPIQQALLSKIDPSASTGEFGRRVAYYVLADLFKAGATETGREAENDSALSIADVESYRVALSMLAEQIMEMKNIPWYVQQQAALLLASQRKPAPLAKTAVELRFYRVLSSFVKFRPVENEVSAQEQLVVSLVGHQLLNDIPHYEKWFIRFCEDRDKVAIVKAWQAIAETAPELFVSLLKSTRSGMSNAISKAPKHLTRYSSARWNKGLAPLPSGKWLPLLTVITHPAELFAQENALLVLARALGRDKSIKSFDPEILTLLNVEVKSDDWEKLNNPRLANLNARAVEHIKTTGGYYDTPSWCRPEEAWKYAFGRLLRAAATGEPDFTARHWLTREDAGWYSGIRSTWHKRRLGMLHTAEGLRGTSAAITPWFSELLLHLLRWPGIAERNHAESKNIRTRSDFLKTIEKRIEEQALIFGESSNLPIYRYPFEWPLNATRGLRVVMVQGLMPLHAHFDRGLEGLDDPGYRERHRNHTAALLHLTTKHLAARDYVLGRSEKPHFDLVVFPELSIHVDDQDLMRAFSDATGAMLFYGLLGAKDLGGNSINAARWLVPQMRAQGRSWIQVDQGKFHLTREERTLGISSWRPYQVVIELHDPLSSISGPYRLTGSICFDATDLALAADLRDESHMYVVSAMNKDVKTFDGMVAALRYHMYQHILIANIGEYGGSTAQAPYDQEHRRLISHSHGNEQLAISVFDVRMQDFGPELQAAHPGITRVKEVTERIGKFPPAGLNRRANS